MIRNLQVIYEENSDPKNKKTGHYKISSNLDYKRKEEQIQVIQVDSWGIPEERRAGDETSLICTP